MNKMSHLEEVTIFVHAFSEITESKGVKMEVWGESLQSSGTDLWLVSIFHKQEVLL